MNQSLSACCALLRPMFLCACWLLAGWTSLARAGDDVPLGLVPAPGILVLRSGQVLAGQIARESDRFYVVLPTGEVRVRASDVEIHCRTLEEAYGLRRQALRGLGVQEHLDLAQWCLQQGLLSQAAEELRTSLSLDPHNPRIALLARRLTVGSPPTAASAANGPAPADVSASESHSPPHENTAAAEPNHLAPTANSANPASPGPHVPTATMPAPTNEELDRLARTMPAGTIEAFAATIQPILVNNCTTAGCHGPAGPSQLQWQRTFTARSTNQRLTLRNLHTTLTLIDRQQPEASPLLVKPLAAHGNGKVPVFADQQAPAYRQLLAWVQQVTQVKEPASSVPPSVTPQSGPLLQTRPFPASAPGQKTPAAEFPGAEDAAATVSPFSEPPRAAGPPQPNSPLPGTPAAQFQSGPQRGAVPRGFVPQDPFDPEQFNRRYSPRPADSAAGADSAGTSAAGPSQ